MAPKKAAEKKKKMMISIEAKQEIINLHEKGTRVVDLARKFQRSTSTICTILKQKDILKGVKPAKGATIISELRTSVHEEMERLLLIWIKEKELAGDTITEAVISEKARAIFADLKSNEPSSSGDPDEFKKMPRRTFITAEEKSLPGHKPMKDRLTLALCANASGDCKVKPLLVYHSENLRAFKTHKILKERLHVLWRSNARAWVMRQFFVDWVNLAFGPTVKEYLLANELPLQALLLLDNAPGHPPALQDDILEEFQFVKVVFLPPNTTSILQPMDQQVIANFKKLYTKHLFRRCFDVTENTNLTLREFWKDHFNIVSCLNIIDLAWQEVSRRNLNSAWKKLWPAAVAPRDSAEPEGETEDITETDTPLEEIVSLGKCMGLEVDEGDINELVEEHEEPLSTEDLKALHEMQQTDLTQEMSSSEEEMQEPQKAIPTSEIKAMLAQWENVVSFVEKNHPEKGQGDTALGTAAILKGRDLARFREILANFGVLERLDELEQWRSGAVPGAAIDQVPAALGSDPAAAQAGQMTPFGRQAPAGPMAAFPGPAQLGPPWMSSTPYGTGRYGHSRFLLRCRRRPALPRCPGRVLRGYLRCQVNIVSLVKPRLIDGDVGMGHYNPT
ncbi:tigger transposable element-derived protein 1-like [Erythrolamprus reginae]|uniref:tigger transposable element-derived protein 1-like n=1 Tax=Erythrolamprus reginae TaxID=121349 RepID=UPI00396C731F